MSPYEKILTKIAQLLKQTGEKKSLSEKNNNYSLGQFFNLHFAGLPHEIIISKRGSHNVEDVQSFVLQIHDKPFAL